MKTIINRLRRLETAVAPREEERAAAEAILENRRRRLGADYKPIECPPGWFDGCRDAADEIIRARLYCRMQRSGVPIDASARTRLS